jgi:hypothetical protein
MKPSRIDQAPWAEASPRERAAVGRLLAAAKTFAPPVQVTFSEIQGALREQRHSIAGPSARLLVAAVVGACVVFVTGGVALSRGWLGRREPAAPTLITVPAGATTRVERRGRFRMSLRGPGAVEVRGEVRGEARANEPSLRLDEGELRVESGEQAVVVQATGRTIEISPSSTVTLEIATPGNLRVGALAGAEPRVDGKPLSQGAPAGVSVAPVSRGIGDHQMPAAPAGASPLAAQAPEPAPAPASVPAPAPASAPTAEPTATGGGAAMSPPRRQETGSVTSSRAGTETTQIRETLARLRTEKNPEKALELLDGYDRRFPGGLWHDDAAIIRIEALLALGRSTEALERFETLPQASLDRSPRLRVTRGELRATHGHCDEALADFSAVLALPVGDEIERRATRGRAACRKMGSEDGQRN